MRVAARGCVKLVAGLARTGAVVRRLVANALSAARRGQFCHIKETEIAPRVRPLLPKPDYKK